MGTIPWSAGGFYSTSEDERRRKWLRGRKVLAASAKAKPKPKTKPQKLDIPMPPAPKIVLATPLAAAAAAPMPVPAPSERVRPDDVVYPSRVGQSDFRSRIIAAYGMCAVTGSRPESVLEAAHIIPYVDHRSHLIENGLCLRADIHRLYDRNLIKIGADLIVWAAPELHSTAYGKMHGRKIRLPARAEDAPNLALLAIRHTIIGEA